jgi:hypothetical protein
VRHPELFRWRLQCLDDDPIVVDQPRPARARLVEQPAIPPREYRARHDTTVCRDTPTRTAISVFDTPSAASSRIRARCARPARTAEEGVHDASFRRSPSPSPKAGAARAGTHRSPAPPSVQRLTPRDTSDVKGTRTAGTSRRQPGSADRRMRRCSPLDMSGRVSQQFWVEIPMLCRAAWLQLRLSLCERCFTWTTRLAGCASGREGATCGRRCWERWSVGF